MTTMLAFLFGDTFWFSSTPLLLVGFLAALVVLAWDWRVSLTALLLVQLGVGTLATQRTRIPEQWSNVLAWVVIACLIILVLSILQSSQSNRKGKMGTFIFRALLLGLAFFLIGTADIGEILPLVDAEMTRLLLWIGFCAIFAIANAEGALENGLALLLWLIATETALIAVAPAAVVVVLLGTIFLLVTLACAYLMVAENVTLARESRVITDITFPAQQPSPHGAWLPKLAAFIRQSIASLETPGQRGNQL